MARAPGHLFRQPTIDEPAILAMLAPVEQTHRNNATAAVAGGAVPCLCRSC